jgi:hypothetical protein
MELAEAKKYAEDVRLHLQMHSSATDYAPSQKDEALICLAAKVTELEARLDIFLCDAVPDKKWDKAFKKSAVDYLRHRAAHFIKNYGDPVRGYRMNQLANEIEKTEAQKKELFGLVKEAIAFPEEVRDIMRRNNIKLDDLKNIYQKLAFTFYSTMAEHSSKASQVIEEYKEIKQPALRAPMDKEV